jgi:hypothetical protein
MSATIFIAPAEKDAKLYTHNGRLLMYIGQVYRRRREGDSDAVPQHHRPATPLPRRLGADLLPRARTLARGTGRLDDTRIRAR